MLLPSPYFPVKPQKALGPLTQRRETFLRLAYATVERLLVERARPVHVRADALYAPASQHRRVIGFGKREQRRPLVRACGPLQEQAGGADIADLNQVACAFEQAGDLGRGGGGCAGAR